jgi:hypothetical protein
MINFKSLKKFLVIIFLLSPVGFAFCQVGPPPPGDPMTDPDPTVPITGIELLIGAGALFGAFKALEKKKNNC